MSTSISKFRIFCITENAWVYVYKPEDEAPTVCPNVNTHIINPDSISKLETVSSNTVLLSTDSTGNTNSNYRHEMKKMTCPPNTTTSQMTTFNYNISILSFQYNTATENLGDEFEVYVHPPSFLGAIDYSIAIGTTVFSFPPEFLANVMPGFLMSFASSDMVTTEETSEVVEVNTVDNTLTIETPIQTAFAAGSYYKFIVPRFKSIYLNVVNINSGVGNYLRASHLQKGFIADVRYKNNSIESKDFVYGIDFLF